VLEVVEHEQRPPPAQVAYHDLARRSIAVFREREGAARPRGDERSVSDGGQIDYSNAIRVVRAQVVRQPLRQPRLTHAAGAAQRQQPDTVAP